MLVINFSSVFFFLLLSSLVLFEAADDETMSSVKIHDQVLNIFINIKNQNLSINLFIFKF